MYKRDQMARFMLRYDDLWETEREIYERYSDLHGHVQNGDVAFLLARIIHLRTLCGDMIRETGRLYDNCEGGQVAEVSAERLAEIEHEAIHLPAGEP